MRNENESKKHNISSNTSNEIPSKAQRTSNQRRKAYIHSVFQQPARPSPAPIEPNPFPKNQNCDRAEIQRELDTLDSQLRNVEAIVNGIPGQVDNLANWFTRNRSTEPDQGTEGRELAVALRALLRVFVAGGGPVSDGISRRFQRNGRGLRVWLRSLYSQMLQNSEPYQLASVVEDSISAGLEQMREIRGQTTRLLQCAVIDQAQSTRLNALMRQYDLVNITIGVYLRSAGRFF